MRGCEKRRAKGKYEKWLEPENLIVVEGWARDGLTIEQIATNMGISRSTLNAWIVKYQDISDVIKKGREVVDRQVENALLKRALGYTYNEISEKFESGILTERKVTRKQVVPDTTAQIFWLKNRKPEEWRDKRVIDDNSNARSEELLRNMQTISDILQHPVKNRSIDDFEEASRDE